MARIAVAREMPVSHDRVWVAIADLASHATWMRDARWIVFVGDQRRGVGTQMRVRTVIGPFRTVDVMEVTQWVEGRSIEVAHRGWVRGQGRLVAEPGGEGTVVTWEETLAFPWWLGGAVTAWLARPILTAIWKENLARLEEITSPRSEPPASR